MDLHGPSEETDKKANDIKTFKVWPEMRKHMSDALKRKEKQKWSIEKPKLDNARRLRGIYMIDPEDKEFKDIMKKARRKLQMPMPAPMPCTTSLCCRTVGEHKTSYACIVEADESVRIRMEGTPHRYHEDHIAEKGINSSSHDNLVRNFIPLCQAMKIPDAMAAETE